MTVAEYRRSIALVDAAPVVRAPHCRPRLLSASKAILQYTLVSCEGSLGEVVSLLVTNCRVHRGERRASSRSALVAMLVKAAVPPVIPFKDEDGEARPAALRVLLSKHGAVNIPDGGLREVLSPP